MAERWEAPSSTGGKFWECLREGSVVVTTWGKLSSKGSSKSTDHLTEAKAIKFVETTIKKKEKEGYVKKGAAKAMPKKAGAKVVEPKEAKAVAPAKTKAVPKKKIEKLHEDWRPAKWTLPGTPALENDPKYWNGVEPSLKKYFPKSFGREEISKYIAVNFVESQKWSEIKNELVSSPPLEEWDLLDQKSEEEDPSEDEGVPTSYVLPPLYNTDAKGKERVHKSWVIKNTLTKQHGETNGKHTSVDRSFEGKNIGRANETDANEQACREAERKWVKQIDKGYKPKTSDKTGYALYKKIVAEKAKQGGVNTNAWMILSKELRGVTIEPPKAKSAAASKVAAAKAVKKANNGTLPGYTSDLFPMGCMKFVPPNREPTDPEEKVLKYMNFENGVYVQRKLDGIRCLVRIIEQDGKKHVVMTSRASNQFCHLKSLRKEVLDFLKDHEDIVLDCEVYQHEIKASVSYKKVGGKNKIVFGEGDEVIPRIMNFKAITSTVRSTMTNPGPLEDQMCLYVFDVVDPTESLDQDARFEKLDELFSRKGIAKKCPKIVQVERFEITSPEEIPTYQKKFVKEGYEGVVLRDKSLKYECLKKNRKSKWMRKYKYFFDQEFVITGVRRDKGVPREQFTWTCQLEDGTEFYPKPEGTREMKWEWYDNQDEYIGKMLIVRYQEFDVSGIPRFPIGVEIRDYE